ncbi:hypothetical protein ES703_93716 [subsurface metagenome]
MEYWAKLNPDGTINSVESHSYPHVVPDAVKITKEEYDTFIASLPGVEPTPPLSTHLARLDNINPGALKPATVTRLFLTENDVTTIWSVTGKEYSCDCFVTQSIVDEWQAGSIVVGDLVLTHFLESDKPIVTHKVFKTW